MHGEDVEAAVVFADGSLEKNIDFFASEGHEPLDHFSRGDDVFIAVLAEDGNGIGVGSGHIFEDIDLAGDGDYSLFFVFFHGGIPSGWFYLWANRQKNRA